ncbi:MAG: outer membrane beta-barrel protein [Bacteroidales bacterium]|nr:outer membrane beta-barrel protein [Bacteroidales bacterium]MBN2750475.1 outer membrane beta-barrel protein [Bacteroidales bacterium]
MRGIILFCFCSILAFPLFSQERKDIGLLLGGSYYIGDFNPGTPLYSPSPALGLLFRYNLNSMYSLRASATYGGLKGTAPVNTYLPSAKSSFSTSVVQAEALFEMNFLKFNTTDHFRNNFAPYVAIGIGGALVDGAFTTHVPFGVGVKYALGGRITIGAEWKMHKTFSDAIDGYVNPSTNSNSLVHNNDWFSFVGLFVTYRLFNGDFICPAYR